MSAEGIVGQLFDGKYRIESEIGKGGMGTVYLAVHVGTERPVALKIIASEFMQRLEFVERFRREARAAGRLRHPNVVNVTDFGFSRTNTGEVAYLVMEYLDGCTLGEVLEEEKKLPLSWTLDILEQVCSAVQEAHEQGVIHRDLKPDNIWLEPNQRGGYTVKVLDFGIAKLEEQIADQTGDSSLIISGDGNAVYQARSTFADHAQSETIADRRHSTAVSEPATIAGFSGADSEAGTLIQPNDVNLESGTAILSADAIQPPANEENLGTNSQPSHASTAKSLSRTPSTAELTRAGAVLGTPLYMSPEQCRGERLTPQSDIYSLGVIAYQMLSGKTPFSGDYLKVMEAHKEIAPPPIDAKKVRKKVKRVITSALSKNVADRPPTAQAFAAELRAESEGIGALLRRSLIIYGEHLPKFLGLSALLYLPVAVITLLQVIISFLSFSGLIGATAKIGLMAFFGVASTFFGIFSVYLIYGTTTWLVTQILAVPLRPVSVRPALKATGKKWRTFAGTGMMTAVITLIGYGLCIVPGMIFSVIWALVAPVVMMEGLRGKAALKRSKVLVKRSLRTTIATVFIMFVVPMLLSGFITFFVDATAKSFTPEVDKSVAESKQARTDETDDRDIKIHYNGKELEVSASTEPQNMARRVRTTIRDALTQILLLPLSILIGSFSSIIVALLYLKTRQVGGESLKELLAQFEEADRPRTNWQKRVHARLEQSGKQTSKS